MSSEILLLIFLVIGIELSMPIGTYLLFSGRHDDKTRLWLASVCFASVGMILVALRPFTHPYLGHELPWMLVVPAFLMMIEALRRESKPKSSWRVFGVLVLCWFLIVNVLYYLGYTESWGIAVYRMTVFVLSSIMWVMVSRLRGVHPSKSLVLLQIGLLLYAVPPLLGLVMFILTSSPDVMNVYKFSLVSNILVFGFMLAVMFISWGYWGFTLEKSERERNLAQVGEGKALQDAERYRQLVEERDRLLVMNSRFSAVSALSSFSAMLQRVIINLLSNALYQFRSHKVPSPLIDIRLFNDNLNNEPKVVIEVTDNGGGFTAEMLERIGQPWTSEHTDNLGMALMLTKQLMGIWGGRLKIANRADGVAGAILRVELRSS